MAVGADSVEVPLLLGQEALVLLGDAIALVVADVHLGGGHPPFLHFGVDDAQARPQLLPLLGALDAHPLDALDGVLEVHLRHQVRVGVVVDERGVLVGAGHPVDVERPIAVEPEISPHAGRLDEDLHSYLPQQFLVAGHLDVLAQCVGDGGVDVVLGGPGRPVGTRLLAVDRPPGEERPSQRQLPGPLAGLVQHRVAVPEEVSGEGRVGVDEERQHEDLGVPEVVAVVGLAGHALGGDAGPVEVGRCLVQLEEHPAQSLLDGRVGADLDVGLLPERVPCRLLGGGHRLNPAAATIAALSSALSMLRSSPVSKTVEDVDGDLFTGLEDIEKVAFGRSGCSWSVTSWGRSSRWVIDTPSGRRDYGLVADGDRLGLEPDPRGLQHPAPEVLRLAGIELGGGGLEVVGVLPVDQLGDGTAVAESTFTRSRQTTRSGWAIDTIRVASTSTPTPPGVPVVAVDQQAPAEVEAPLPPEMSASSKSIVSALTARRSGVGSGA